MDAAFRCAGVVCTWISIVTGLRCSRNAFSIDALIQSSAWITVFAPSRFGKSRAAQIGYTDRPVAWTSIGTDNGGKEASCKRIATIFCADVAVIAFFRRSHTCPDDAGRLRTEIGIRAGTVLTGFTCTIYARISGSAGVSILTCKTIRLRRSHTPKQGVTPVESAWQSIIALQCCPCALSVPAGIIGCTGITVIALPSMLEHRAALYWIAPIQRAGIIIQARSSCTTGANPFIATVLDGTRISIVTRKGVVLENTPHLPLAGFRCAGIVIEAENFFPATAGPRVARCPSGAQIPIIAGFIIKDLINNALTRFWITGCALAGARTEESELAISIHDAFTRFGRGDVLEQNGTYRVAFHSFSESIRL